MTESFTGSQEKTTERIPTYDSFGDGDEALAWVLNRLSFTYKPEGVQQWWNAPNANLGDISPVVFWDHDPNQVLRLVARIEN